MLASRRRAAVFLHRVGDLAFEVELLLSADVEDAFRRWARLEPRAVAALQVHRVEHELCAARLTGEYRGIGS
jgi:hypothetical protein